MKWTADLAYVVGLITTDGSLSKDGRHIDFTSKDYDQILALKNILKLKNKIGLKSSGSNPNNKYYRIQFGNMLFYKFLLEIGLKQNKSKTLKSILIPDKYFPDFLRGHLDGDGFTYSYWDKRWKSSFMLYTGFISASKRHLIWIQEQIFRLYKIKGAIKYSGRSAFQLMYAKRSSVSLLNIIYYSENISCLKRKRFKIDSALGIIGEQAEVVKLVYTQS